MSKAKRALAVAFVSALLLALMAAPALAFHHGGLPSTACSNDAAVSPSDENGQAKEQLADPTMPPATPLPPVGTPGAGQGEGGDHCAETQPEG